MAIITKIIFYLTTTVLFFGPSFRLNLFSTSVPVFDILLILYTLTNLLSSKVKHHRFIVFASWAIFTYFLNLSSFQPSFKSLFYLIRLVNFCILFSITPKLTKTQIKYLSLVIIANIVFGIIQYFLWPNLSNYQYLGWDPHLNRLTSTFLDPTFTGLLFLLFLIYSYFTNKSTFILILIYISMALTYSRSSLLSLFSSSLFVSKIKKNNTLSIKTILIILLTNILLPDTVGEGTNLIRTSTIKAKIDNYKQAIALIVKKPIIGYGYGNLEKARAIDPKNHSSQGFDSSLLTITSTSGIIGLLLFTNALAKLFYHSNLAQKTLLISVLVHCQFSNSLLYPWIYFSLISLYSATKSRK